MTARLKLDHNNGPTVEQNFHLFVILIEVVSYFARFFVTLRVFFLSLCFDHQRSVCIKVTEIVLRALFELCGYLCLN